MQRILKLLFFLLYISSALASGTYVPPVTSYVPLQSATSASSRPTAPIPQLPPRPKRAIKVRRTFNDNQYNAGQKYLYHETSAENHTRATCSTCHSGNNAFNREALINKKDRLAEIIKDCNGPHRVYCKEVNNVSSMVSKADSIAYALKIRYGLET